MTHKQSAVAVYYHVERTGLSTAVILTTWSSNRYVVDVSRKGCSCEVYQEELILCRHATKFHTFIEKDPKQYCL